jgi:hypothetical protein
MSFGTFVGFVTTSAVLGFGQWLFLKLFNNRKADFIPLFGSLLLVNISIFLIRGMFYVVEILTATRMQADLSTATLLGMTELELLKKLDLLSELDGEGEQEDPRSQVYILYINTI